MATMAKVNDATHQFQGLGLGLGMYFVNYRSWQAEILQEHAEGCIQVDLQKKIHHEYTVLPA